ncbi:MAG TPA: phosphoribosyltransferase family protein [Kofleriaceae bacterium]|nr:phosphoribosyltransferase family protein [Kofleriaceae bacterium]
MHRSYQGPGGARLALPLHSPAKVMFDDRTSAGLALAGRLDTFRGRPDLVVIAVPRGGAPVAAEVARALGAPLDISVARRLHVPGQPKVVLGAITSGGIRVIRRVVVERYGLTQDEIERAAIMEAAGLAARERALRGDRAPVNLHRREVLLVDDGLAVADVMSVAVLAARGEHARRVVVAAPVAAPEVRDEIAAEADEVITLLTPDPFHSVAACYRSYPHVSDEDVRALLARAAQPERPSPPAA